MSALNGLGGAIRHFIDSGPAAPALFGYLAALALPAALLHELGHALLAARSAGDPVRIWLGGTRHVLRVRLRRLRLTVSLLTQQPSSAGASSFDAACTSARELILIALGGPVASLAGLAVAACGLASTSGHGVLHNLLWAATVTGFFAALGAVPLEIRARTGGARLRTDGRVVLDAVRAQRSLSSAAAFAAPASQ